MTYRFYHTFDSGRRIGYEVKYEWDGDDLIFGMPECIEQPLLYQEDEHEYHVFVEWLKEEAYTLASNLLKEKK